NELILKAELSTPHIAGYSYDGKVAGMVMIYAAACECFGLEARHCVEDFLPPPEIAEINVDPESGDEQTIIQDVVQHIYVINRDDFNTREILIVPQDERGKWFDDLRKSYPVRREFQNTKVVFTKPNASLSNKLKGIGFKIG
ncbi:MAG: DUF3410 domain-containing protein, partial [Planctomycetes bacterium]|nr:DUF3410 domain-containing protein [Planctomycetota bacterium]